MLMFTNAKSEGNYEQTTPKAWLAADLLVSQDSYRSRLWVVRCGNIMLPCLIMFHFYSYLYNRVKTTDFHILHQSQLQAFVPSFAYYVWPDISGKISNVVCSQLAMMLQVFDRPESHSELPVDSNEPMIIHTVHKWTNALVNISLCKVQSALVNIASL